MKKEKKTIIPGFLFRSGRSRKKKYSPSTMEELINFYTRYDDEKDPNGKSVLIGCTGEIFRNDFSLISPNP